MKCDVCNQETNARVTRNYEGHCVGLCLDCFAMVRGSPAMGPAAAAA